MNYTESTLNYFLFNGNNVAFEYKGGNFNEDGKDNRGNITGNFTYNRGTFNGNTDGYGRINCNVTFPDPTPVDFSFEEYSSWRTPPEGHVHPNIITVPYRVKVQWFNKRYDYHDSPTTGAYADLVVQQLVPGSTVWEDTPVQIIHMHFYQDNNTSGKNVYFGDQNIFFEAGVKLRMILRNIEVYRNWTVDRFRTSLTCLRYG